MLSTRLCLRSLAILRPFTRTQLVHPRRVSFLPIRPRNLPTTTTPFRRHVTATFFNVKEDTPLTGMEEFLMDYVSGTKRATDVVHQVWKHVVQKGDTVIDATCGNGHDTAELLKLVSDDSGNGCVYGIDIQKDALLNTHSLIDKSFSPEEKKKVKLFNICHVSMSDVIPDNTPIRVIAFNLGYLPGGEKAITTQPNTTRQALEAAKRIVMKGGLINVVAYVGHPGGRDEYKTVNDFARHLHVGYWTCCKFQIINKPWAPIVFCMFRKR